MSYVYRLPVTVDDLGPSATPADLERWEWLHHLEVVGEDRLVSYDYDAVRRRDVYEVATDNDALADEIVSELCERVWNAFCSHDVPPVQP